MLPSSLHCQDWTESKCNNNTGKHGVNFQGSQWEICIHSTKNLSKISTCKKGSNNKTYSDFSGINDVVPN